MFVVLTRWSLNLCVSGPGELDSREIGDCVHSASTLSSTDLCLPALDYLHRCSQVPSRGVAGSGVLKVKSVRSPLFLSILYSSWTCVRCDVFERHKINEKVSQCALTSCLRPLQLLGKIYRVSSRPVFLGARLASLPPHSQDRSVSTEDGVECVLQEFDDDTGKLVSLLHPPSSLSGRVSSRCGPAPSRSDPGVAPAAGAADGGRVHVPAAAPAAHARAAVRAAAGGRRGAR